MTNEDSVGAGMWTQTKNNLPCTGVHFCPCAQHVQSRIEAWFTTVWPNGNPL